MFMLFIEIFFNDSFLLYNKILLCKKCMQNYVLKLLSFCLCYCCRAYKYKYGLYGNKRAKGKDGL